MQQKIRKFFFSFWDNCIWRCCNKLSLLRRQYLSSTVHVLSNSPKVLHITKREIFPTELRSEWSINMVLSFRFQQCLGSFTMFLVEGSSETGLFRHLSNHIFRSPSVQKHIIYQGHLLFWKCCKFNQDFHNAIKIGKMYFSFLFASEHLAINCLYQEDNTCHRQSMC